MGGGSKGRGRKGGGDRGGNRDGNQRDKQKEARERQLAADREWDRATFPRRRGERDVWDDQPTFKVIHELEDRRTQDQLEEILTAAEDKLTSLREQLSDSTKMQQEQENLKAQLQAKVDGLHQEKQLKQEGIEEIDGNIEASKNVTHQIREKIKAIQEEKDGIKAAKREKYKAHGLNPKSVPSEVDAKSRIREVEREMETCRNLTRNAERQYMQEIRKLENVRHVIKELERLDKQIGDKDEEIKLCKKEIGEIDEEKRGFVEKKDALKEEMSAITKSIANAKRNLQQSANQDVAAQERRQTDFVDLMTHKVGYRAAKTKFEAALGAWEQEKDAYMRRRREEEQILLARESKWKEQQERRDQALAKKRENPWVQEKAVCESLLQYLEHLVPKAARDAMQADTAAPSAAAEAAEAQEPQPPAAADAEASVPAQAGGDDADKEAARVNGQPPEGATIIHDPNASEKKGAGEKGEDWLFGDRTKEIKAAKSKQGAEPKKDDPKLKHDLQHLKDFDILKMPLPATRKEAVVALDQLRKRKEWLQTAAYDAPMPDWRPGHEGQEGERRRGGKGEGRRGKGKGGKGGKGGGKGGKGDRGGGKGRDRQGEGRAERPAPPANSGN